MHPRRFIRALLVFWCGSLLSFSAACDSTPDNAAPTGTGVAAPACCGCLCADPTWSCASSTCTNELRQVEQLGSEAGFFEVPVRQQPTQGRPLEDTPSGRARMWYSFRPADTAPETRPLLVIFQGGPVGGMSILWGGNTAPITLDVAPTSTMPWADNPSSWTRFANLLYVDSPFAGFSYFPGGLPNQALDDDAAAFVRLVLRFLARHPSLQRNEVVLVGESYGGARANRMLQQLLHYPALRQPGVRFHDPSLADEIEQYLRQTRAMTESRAFSPQEVAETFAAQVLIQGVTVRPASILKPESMHEDPERLDTLVSRLVELDTLLRITDVDVRSIAWLAASSRVGAFRCAGPGSVPVNSPTLSAALGPLGSDDAYYLPYCEFKYALDPANAARGDGHEPDDDARFTDTLRYVDTFATDAPRDEVVLSRIALTQTLATQPSIASVELVPRGERVHNVVVHYKDGSERTIRLPLYADSLHAVSLYEPALLSKDLADWLEERRR